RWIEGLPGHAASYRETRTSPFRLRPAIEPPYGAGRMTTPLLEEVIERDLQQIRDELQKMVGLVVRALKEAIQALQSRDRRLAYSVILGDNRIDALEG